MVAVISVLPDMFIKMLSLPTRKINSFTLK